MDTAMNWTQQQNVPTWTFDQFCQPQTPWLELFQGCLGSSQQRAGSWFSQPSSRLLMVDVWPSKSVLMPWMFAWPNKWEKAWNCCRVCQIAAWRQWLGPPRSQRCSRSGANSPPSLFIDFHSGENEDWTAWKMNSVCLLVTFIQPQQKKTWSV